MATLNNPITTQTLDTVKVVSFKVEDNPSSQQYWVLSWSVLGYMDGPTFIEYMNPLTGQQAVYHRIENGFNPLMEGRMLGKCDDCDEWVLDQNSGTCPLCGVGTVEPYDGYTRLYKNQKIKTKDIEDFLCDEEVPDPDTGVVQYILDATKDS